MPHATNARPSSKAASFETLSLRNKACDQRRKIKCGSSVEAHQPCEGGRRTKKCRRSPQEDVAITQVRTSISMKAAARKTASAASSGDLAANGPPSSAPVPYQEPKVNGRGLLGPTLRWPPTESTSSQYEIMALDGRKEAHTAQHNMTLVWRVRSELLDLPLLAATKYLTQTGGPEFLSIKGSKTCTSDVLGPVEELIVPSQFLAHENQPSSSLYSVSASLLGPPISFYEMNSRAIANSEYTSVELRAEELDSEDLFGFSSRNQVLEPMQMPVVSETGNESNLSEVKVPENVGFEELERYLAEATVQNTCRYDSIPKQ